MTSPAVPEKLRERADKLAADYLASAGNLGLVIGAVVGDQRFASGYGKESRGGDRVPGEHTIYEIASVTKVFNAVMLAEMVTRGEVRLDQPVTELLPPDVKVPSYRGQPITLAQLAEHTSSLPRLPGNIGQTVKDEKNPYRDYEVRHLYEYLNGARLAFPPGSGEAYSNLGAGLLGHALSLRAGMPFEELMAERVLRPLGLHDTAIALSPDQAARMAPGHDESGEPTPNWDTPSLAGAGALRSSVGELLTFLRANLDLAPTPLKDALELCQTPRPVAWWRRIPVGAPVALGLAGLSLLVQWAVPVPPGSTRFFALFVLPVLVCLVWKGFWSGVTAAVAIWLGCLLLWGSLFGWEPAGLTLLLLLGVAGFWGGYIPPPRRAYLGWQATSVAGRRAFWHNGGTGGYCSFVGMVRDSGVAVAVLSNTANSVDDIGMGLLEYLHDLAASLATERKGEPA
jgi:CubicO group peptidase (beta-lactamase class C family)